jgi:hypothetical protein
MAYEHIHAVSRNRKASGSQQVANKPIQAEHAHESDNLRLVLASLGSEHKPLTIKNFLKRRWDFVKHRSVLREHFNKISSCAYALFHSVSERRGRREALICLASGVLKAAVQYLQLITGNGIRSANSISIGWALASITGRPPGSAGEAV